jgi:hypothetical protein
MIRFWHNLAFFRVKNANFFRRIFAENILKIITSIPDCRQVGDYCQLWAVLLRITRVAQHTYCATFPRGCICST